MERIIDLQAKFSNNRKSFRFYAKVESRDQNQGNPIIIPILWMKTYPFGMELNTSVLLSFVLRVGCIDEKFLWHLSNNISLPLRV